jgi:hypothetical protein
MFLAIPTPSIIIAALILAALCVWYISHRSEAKLKKSIEKESDATLFLPQFRCVVISPCDNSCKTALEYRTKPILINNVPALPLIGCNAKQCECSFLQYEDRRVGESRRNLEEVEKKRVYTNRRLFKDRRRASIKEFLLPQYRQFS